MYIEPNQIIASVQLIDGDFIDKVKDEGQHETDEKNGSKKFKINMDLEDFYKDLY